MGALLGVETGPGLIITGAIGALVGGVLGYMGADWFADWIDDNSVKELRTDVNYIRNMENRGIKLTVGRNESQYDFVIRALKRIAQIAQQELPPMHAPQRAFDSHFP